MPHVHDRAFGLPSGRRLRKPAEFAAVLSARGPLALRLARRWFSMNAVARPAEAGIRFGFTVGKRNARRSVDRILVKRILRESARHAAPQVQAMCAQHGLAIDLSLRLKSSLPRAGRDIGLAELKQSLRADVDALLSDLGRQFERMAASNASAADA
ncbi:MAG: ribonuclease P protein component [Burkholderiaceae bacterium]